MKLTAQDFVHLRWSAVALLAALLSGTAMVLITNQLVVKAEREQRQITLQRNEMRSRVANARAEEQEFRSRVAAYEKIVASGLIGQEERLDWVEQIGRIQTARRLIDLQYEISPQRPIDEAALPGGAAAGGFEYMASRMKLRMALLHEEDLLGFLDDLGKSVRAHLLVRECAIARGPGAVRPRGPAPQLQAECTIDWVTLREATS